MSEEPFFVCSDCGSNVLALSHTWKERARLEEVGYVGDDGRYTFDDQVELGRSDDDHQWIAYCGGCGRGVTVEWLSENRVRLLLQEEDPVNN
jgi:hypothetical protein